MTVIEDILTASGVQYREARFPKPPSGTYAVYMDDVDTDGPDDMNMIRRHSYTIELYEPCPDIDSEAAIEAAIDAVGLRWTKQARYWIHSEQLYQAVYEFDYIEKKEAT